MKWSIVIHETLSNCSTHIPPLLTYFTQWLLHLNITPFLRLTACRGLYYMIYYALIGNSSVRKSTMSEYVSHISLQYLGTIILHIQFNRWALIRHTDLCIIISHFDASSVSFGLVPLYNVDKFSKTLSIDGFSIGPSIQSNTHAYRITLNFS